MSIVTERRRLDHDHSGADHVDDAEDDQEATVDHHRHARPVVAHLQSIRICRFVFVRIAQLII